MNSMRYLSFEDPFHVTINFDTANTNRLRIQCCIAHCSYSILWYYIFRAHWNRSTFKSTFLENLKHDMEMCSLDYQDLISLISLNSLLSRKGSHVTCYHSIKLVELVYTASPISCTWSRPKTTDFPCMAE
jgi:hypothetical protein